MCRRIAAHLKKYSAFCVAAQGVTLIQRHWGQILVGASVHETLRQREKYMSCWRAYTACGKHDVSFPVYQFVSDDTPGLDVSEPSAFLARRHAPRQEPEKLSEPVAYYLAHANANREFLTSRKSDSLRDYCAGVVLWFLAEDSVEAAKSPLHQEPRTKSWQAGAATFAEQYEHYAELDFWVLAGFFAFIKEKHLSRFPDAFARGRYQTSFWLPSPVGLQRLAAEWPSIASQFGISSVEG